MVEVGHHAGDGCADLERFGRVGLAAGFLRGLQRFVRDGDFARHAVEFEEDDAVAVFVRGAEIDQLDEKRFALLDFHRDFLAGFEPVEKGGGGKDADIAEFALELGERGEDVRIHEVAVEFILVGRVLEFAREFLAHSFKTDLRGAGRFRLRFAEHGFDHVLRPSADRFAESAGQHVLDRFGERRARREVGHVGGFDAASEKEKRHVTDDFARGCDFDDVAEELVDLGIAARDFRPAVREAHGGGLLFQVGELAAGHLVQIHLGASGARRSVERRVERADLLPVIGEFVECVEVEPAVVRRVLQRGNEAVEIRLRG